MADAGGRTELYAPAAEPAAEDGWQLFSVSRWSGEDGKRLKNHLELEFEEKTEPSDLLGRCGNVLSFSRV